MRIALSASGPYCCFQRASARRRSHRDVARRAVTVFSVGRRGDAHGQGQTREGRAHDYVHRLPASAVPGSIRVEGKATGKLDIGSVDTRTNISGARRSQAADAERKKLEDEIEALARSEGGYRSAGGRGRDAEDADRQSRAAPCGRTRRRAERRSEDWQRVLSHHCARHGGREPRADRGPGQRSAISTARSRISRTSFGSRAGQDEQTEVKVHVEAGVAARSRPDHPLSGCERRLDAAL